MANGIILWEMVVVIMNEEQSITRIQNILMGHNLRQPQDYIFNHVENGCFNISICPHRYAVIDIEYFYNNLPDIKAFKIQQKGKYMNLLIKVKLRDEKKC